MSGKVVELLLWCVGVVGIQIFCGVFATSTAMSRYAYARVDTPGRRQYEYLIDYVSPRQGTHMVLKAQHRQQYFVLNTSTWWATGYPAVKDFTNWLQNLQQMNIWLHNNAEKFDTLEQAMLYYHLVK